MQTLTTFAKSINSSETSGQDKKIIAVAGGKGGVGKTVITAAMGIALATQGHRTIVIDADFGGANLHQVLGILTPPKTMRDFVTRRETQIHQLLLETCIPNLFLLAGTPGALGLANMQFSIKQKILRNVHRLDADFVLLDLGAGNCFNQLDYFNSADLGVVVITPEPLAIQDGYNFVKVCLYRRLFRLFHAYPEIRSLNKLFLSPSDNNFPTIQELTEHVRELGSFVSQQWEDAIHKFRPCVLVNMVENQHDFFETAALQIAAREILNVNLEYYNYVRYDDHIRRAARLMRPDILMSDESNAAADILIAVRKMVFNNGHDNDIAHKFNDRDTAVQDTIAPEEDIICSVRCALWDQCSAQCGGFPCRIKMVGFVNQRQ